MRRVVNVPRDEPAAQGGMLDLKLSLYLADGTLIATSDTASLGETISENLSAGTYKLVVASHGGYGDIGQYTVSGTIVPHATPAAPSGLAATAIGTNRIDLAWTDNSSNETGFAIERSTDNASWLQVATLGAGATSYSDTPVAE